MSESPYVGVVADLVDPYLTPDTKNVGGFKSSSPATDYALWWMRRHPGRWALVGENGTGLTKHLLRPTDFECRELTKNTGGVTMTYGRLPHPLGEPLLEALKRRPTSQGLYLPEVTKDPFGWSKAELAEACQIARDNLFPVSS